MYVNAETWLKKIRSLKRAIENKQRLLEKLENETFLNGISYDSIKLKTSPNLDSFEKKILKNLEKREKLQAKIEDEITEMRMQQDKAVDLINMIDSEDQQQVLMLRYIEGYEWSNIMVERHCDDLSGQYKLHRRALESMQKLLNVYSMSI